jgi:hypothetical protein
MVIGNGKLIEKGIFKNLERFKNYLVELKNENNNKI